MTILAIDPGPTESAYVLLADEAPLVFAKLENNHFLRDIVVGRFNTADVCVIEQIASYGMSVGAEVFETCFWSGRFAQAFGANFARMPRLHVKLHWCGLPRARDSNVRQAIIDHYGGKAKAIGTPAAPGPLYGIKADVWQALALGLAWQAKTQQASS